jgi:hypothetical protein
MISIVSTPVEGQEDLLSAFIIYQVKVVSVVMHL